MTFLQHIISEKSFARFFVRKFVMRLSTKFWNLRPTFPIDTLGGHHRGDRLIEAFFDMVSGPFLGEKVGWNAVEGSNEKTCVFFVI